MSAAVDLSQCDREPIHLLGGIQPHGALLGFDESSGAVQVVSANAGVWLGGQTEALLGRPVASLMSEASTREVSRALLAGDLGDLPPLALQVGMPPRPMEGVLHRTDGLAVLELEPPPHPKAAGPTTDPFSLMRQALRRLQSAHDTRALCELAVREVQTLTGFDRVLAYVFDADWNGEVVAEARVAGVDSFLGMHFPATDIPAQARKLYQTHTLRLIADVDAPPSGLIRTGAEPNGRPLDLSGSALRSVSPVHLQYLRNMGVRASMSISLLRDAGLWGLIACHHAQPLRVPAQVRSACAFFGQLMSVELASVERRTLAEDVARRATLQTRLVERLASAQDLSTGLKEGAGDLLALTDATGAALLIDDTPIRVGDAPPLEALTELARWLTPRFSEDVWSTASLPSLYPPAEPFKEVASGLLATRLSAAPPRYALFFRPEVLRTVTWAGNPDKAAQAGPDQALHPRQSFAAWEQTVQRTSRPWEAADVAAAGAFRGALVGVVLARAERLEALNEQLERSNEELDAFSYTVSHDLKEPLRGIGQYVEFLREDHADAVGPAGREKLEALGWLSQRMSDLLDGLFELSRVGRVDLAREEISLQELVDDVLRTLVGRLRENGTEVRIPRPLPTVWCDRVRVRQVFANLISNASKYNDKVERWVEVGFQEGSRPTIYYVRDNGIGIPERFHKAVFDMFRRLHPHDRYGGGTGAGLAIARRVVERHGGRLWLESKAGVGTTFFFTLGA